MWVYLTLTSFSFYILYRNFPDIGDILLFIVHGYEKINNLLKPIKLIMEDKREITEVYINNKKSTIEKIKECDDRDLVEILWRNRYRAIYNGNNLDLTCPFDSCSDTTNILFANLYKSNGEVIDITERLNEYSGPTGNFFKNYENIHNDSKNLYDSDRNLMLSTKDDYIILMDKRGEEIRIEL